MRVCLPPSSIEPVVDHKIGNVKRSRLAIAQAIRCAFACGQWHQKIRDAGSNEGFRAWAGHAEFFGVKPSTDRWRQAD